MSAKALVKDQVHRLVRKNPTTGRTERISFVGELRSKPAGWRIEKFLGRAMGCEQGTC